jgi:hypothetical protein
MNCKSMVFGLGVVMLLATGCSSDGTRTVREPVPPRIDLRAYPTVGLVGFSSNARGELDRISTQRFLRAVQAAQPGSRVVELGSEQQVLASVGRRNWDRETIRMVKEQHGVDAVVLGHLEVVKSKPEVAFSSFVKRMSVSQDVNVELTARLMETDSGATMWTDGAKTTANLANASFDKYGGGSFNASDPDATYGEMIDGLVYRVTDGFRTHWVTRRVQVNSQAVARAE